MIRKHRWLLALAVASALLVVSAGGFSEGAVQREVTVSVAQQDRAVVSIWDPGAGGTGPEPPRYPGEDPITPNETRGKILVVENRFGVGQSVSLSVTDREDSLIDIEGEYATLSAAEITPIYATVDYNGETGPVETPLGLRVTVDGSSVTAIINTRAVVVCAGQTGSSEQGQ